ncbi:MAG: glycoside hydrolase family 3 protein [Ruminococcus flavefaciens]|nr:glycoside hydrolase family 3 protein [Ruminococcus flavefaciens]
MKRLKRNILAVMTACMMMTGCGQVVQNMQDIPVMSEQQSATQTSTETETTTTDIVTSATAKGYTVAVTETVSGTLAEPHSTPAVTTTTVSSQRVVAHVAGTSGAVHNDDSGIQRGTTHVVPVNPNLNTAGLTARTTATKSTTTTTTTANNATTAKVTSTAKTTAIVTTATTVTSATTVTTTTATTVPVKPDNPQAMLEQMSLEEKVYQMFMVKPEQITNVYPTTASGETTKNAIAEYPVGGLIYFADNLVSVPQTESMLANVQQFAKESSGVGIFTAIDEEGGTVARAALKLGTTSFSDMVYYGERNDSDEGYYIGQTIGYDLRNLGFNLDFAPVADVNINEYNELGGRIFSSDPYVVANMATAVARGLQDAGVSATLKHFPGLGAEDGNTHEDSFVVIDRTLDQLRETEFVPFRAGIEAGVDFVMVSHQIVTGFEDNLPADLSYSVVTECLRNELGFDGIVITDAQQMNTISTVYSSGESAVMSVKAGVDIILMPEDLTEAVNAVCYAVNSGEISEDRIDESVMRILNQKYEMGLF